MPRGARVREGSCNAMSFEGPCAGFLGDSGTMVPANRHPGDGHPPRTAPAGVQLPGAREPGGIFRA